MIRHDPVLPPEYIFPIDDWRWVERRFTPEFVAQSETTFSTANGYLGMRGGFMEGRPSFLHGTFINGFYETWPIPYGEKAYGFAKTGQTMVNVPDGKIIRLYVDDEPFTVDRAPTTSHYERALDMRSGTLEREIVWETPSGKQVRIRSTLLVSLAERHLAAIRYEVTVLNAKAPVVVVSEMVNHAAIVDTTASEQGGGAGVAAPVQDDPRLAKAFKDQVLVTERLTSEGMRVLMGYTTRSSGLRLGCGMDHLVVTENTHTAQAAVHDTRGSVVFNIDAEPGKSFTLYKFVTYHDSSSETPAELRARAGRTLDRALRHGYDRILADHRAVVQDFWRRSDLETAGGHPRLQQCIRWNLFQMLQATARVERAGVPAKGLTGQAYEGHYFWDMEVYVLPFLIYTAPRVARNLLTFRHGMLDHARARARELNQRGCLFPWRTISGEEASAYYAAGTAQYHINAAIAYAVKKYVEVTGDTEFLLRFGGEMLVETARLWYDLGFFNDRAGGKFCIHGVTGPDEYTTVVNNNAYTNLMARENLWYAAAAVEMIRKEHPEHYTALAHRTGLGPGEAADWKRAADQMHVPYDERTRINPQDDSFLDREVWDIKNTPKDKFPLLLHYHPLVIYRHQVIKQADMVLAMFLLGNEFTLEQKRRNFDYYDPLTTGDSSLSACIQSIVAAEIGYDDAAIKYLRYSVLMDLADVGGNVRDGVHIASIGGTWMAMIYGLAGLRDYGGKISLAPRKFVQKLKFPLTVRGQRLEVDIDNGSVTYLLREGAGLTIRHFDEEVKLVEGKGVTRSF